MNKWHLIQNQPLLWQIFKEPPIISFKKGKSLKDTLVRAKNIKVLKCFTPVEIVWPVNPWYFLPEISDSVQLKEACAIVSRSTFSPVMLRSK